MKMRAVLVAIIVIGPSSASATPCQPPNQPNGQPYDLEAHGLQWCARDHGFNEGATCGLSGLAGINLTGLPALAPQPILGNTWDRTNMIGAAKAAAKAGHVEAAVNAAICCQIHNPHMHTCMMNHRSEIAAWLRSN